MPSLSPLGRVVHRGPGAGPMRTWLSLHLTIEQACGGNGCRLVSRLHGAGEAVQENARGANYLVAGGGAWAARLEDGSGYRDIWGRQEPGWRPLAVDPDSGAILVSPTNGADLAIVWQSAVETIVTGPLAMEASFRHGTIWYSRDYVTWQRWPDGFTCPVRGRGLRHDGDLVVMNAAHGVVVFDVRLPARGVVLDSVGFNPDICRLPDGTVRVATSRTAGEAPEDVTVYDVVFGPRAAAVTVTPRPTDEPARIVLYTDLTVPPRVTVPAIGRGIWLAWFEYDLPNRIAPSNGYIEVFQGRPWLTVRSHDGRVLCRYVAGAPEDGGDGNAAAVEKAIAHASGAGFEVCAYVPKKLYETGYLPSCRLYGIEFYQKAGESDQAFEDRGQREIDRAREAGKVPVLVPQCYSSNDTNVQDLARIPAPAARLARDNQDVWALLPFSGSGRSTGYQDHPEVHELWHELAAGITGPGVFIAPSRPPVDPPKPPKPEEPKPPVPPPAEPKDDMKSRDILIRTAGSQTLVTVEPGGELMARGTLDAVGEYQVLRAHLLDGAHDVGKRVIFESTHLHHRTEPLFVGLTSAQPAGSAVPVFTIARGEFGGSWAYLLDGKPWTFGQHPDHGPRFSAIDPDGSTIGGWQSHYVMDAATRKDLREPF